MKTRILILFLSFLTLAGAFGQSALSVNSSTGAIVGPVSAANFRTNNTIQSLDSDLTSWAAITRGTGFDTAAAINVGSAGAFVTNGGALGTPTSGVGTNLTLLNATNLGSGTVPDARFPATLPATAGTNLTGTASSFTAGHATDAASLSISGQTGLLSFTGLTSTNRIKTVSNAADTILELGGSYTPTGTWTNMVLVTPALGTPSALVGTNISGTGDSFTAGSVTRNHAVYAAASPPTVDVGNFTIVKTGVDLKTAGTTTIFTVPASRTFVTTGVLALVTSVTSGGAGTEQFQLKESGASGSMSGAQTSASGTPVANSTFYTEQITPTTAPYIACAATNSVQIVVSTSQAGSTAVSGSVFVSGFYVQ